MVLTSTEASTVALDLLNTVWSWGNTDVYSEVVGQRLKIRAKVNGAGGKWQVVCVEAGGSVRRSSFAAAGDILFRCGRLNCFFF